MAGAFQPLPFVLGIHGSQGATPVASPQHPTPGPSTDPASYTAYSQTGILYINDSNFPIFIW